MAEGRVTSQKGSRQHRRDPDKRVAGGSMGPVRWASSPVIVGRHLSDKEVSSLIPQNPSDRWFISPGVTNDDSQAMLVNLPVSTNGESAKPSRMW